MLRFAVPTAALGSDFLAEKFMASDYEASQNAIDTAMGKASKVTLSTPTPAAAPIAAPVAPTPALPASQPPAKSGPWWKPHMPSMPTMPTLKLPSLPNMTLPTIPNFGARFEEMKAAAEQATEHMVRLMAIFLLQTLVLPILLLWALYGVAKGVFQLPRKLPELGLGGGKI